jgi:hypothetical protein
MAGGTLSVHTRLVRRKGRADTRASTEPHAGRAETQVDTTTPYRRDFEPRAEMESAARDSLPYYCEIEVSGATLDTQEITNPKPKVDTEAETIEIPRQPKAALLANGSGPLAAIADPKSATLVEPKAESRAATRPANWSWLGVVMAQPEVGAALVIGTRTRGNFCVTSPITRLFPREGGTLVLTSTKSRYFVEPGGDAYLVRKVG